MPLPHQVSSCCTASGWPMMATATPAAIAPSENVSATKPRIAARSPATSRIAAHTTSATATTISYPLPSPAGLTAAGAGGDDTCDAARGVAGSEPRHVAGHAPPADGSAAQLVQHRGKGGGIGLLLGQDQRGTLRREQLCVGQLLAAALSTRQRDQHRRGGGGRQLAEGIRSGAAHHHVSGGQQIGEPLVHERQGAVAAGHREVPVRQWARRHAAPV